MKDKAFAVWLTGLPGAGKSVISEKLKEILNQNNIEAKILRMDNMREYVTPEPKYTDEERQLVYNAFSYTAKLLVENGVNVIMDATGNLKKYRGLAGRIVPNFMQVFLKCPLKTAIKREIGRDDTKGAPEEIYEKAMKEKAENVPGLQAEYEKPDSPDILIQTDKIGIKESAELIFKELQKRYNFIREEYKK
jgi:adenylylsulfate kinase